MNAQRSLTPTFATVSTVARRLSLSESGVRARIRRGELRPVAFTEQGAALFDLSTIERAAQSGVETR